MKRAFIVRPFETKEVSPGRNVDFERVERELIAPALEKLRIHGRTTAEILHQGEIQSDMFHRLMTAQLVIADVSMANANVFYELGIRHALQDRYTVLIKFPIEGQKAVFDIATDRYMVYDPDHPGASVEALVKRIRATLDNDEPDSPVFRFLPGLKPQEREAFIKLPVEFTEAVELAQRKCYDGDLETFAAELFELDIPWANAGLRLVGNAQFKRKAWDAARVTWEVIRETSPDESLANRRLATIYQKQPQARSRKIRPGRAARARGSRTRVGCRAPFAPRKQPEDALATRLARPAGSSEPASGSAHFATLRPRARRVSPRILRVFEPLLFWNQRTRLEQDPNRAGKGVTRRLERKVPIR